jgi:putative Holliday junction resolvase
VPANDPTTPPAAARPPGRIAGIDYGTKRIGVAITDRRQTLASPLENYTRSGREADARHFQQLAQREEIRLFVVGLPVHLSGAESQKSHEARRFGQWLAETTGVPVEFFDERFTSAEAERHLLAAELTNKRRKSRLDMVAAQILLSAFLESSAEERARLRGLDE